MLNVHWWYAMDSCVGVCSGTWVVFRVFSPIAAHHDYFCSQYEIGFFFNQSYISLSFAAYHIWAAYHTPNIYVLKFRIFQQHTAAIVKNSIYGSAEAKYDHCVKCKKIGHWAKLWQVLEWAQSNNLKLNLEMVKISKEIYVGHVISADGFKPDPEKVWAVRLMPAPTSTESVRRFLGFVQYLSKFLAMLAEVEEPLRELTRDDMLFH